MVLAGSTAVSSATPRLRAQSGLNSALEPLQPPTYAQVNITGGVPLAQQQNTKAIFDGFDDDALLKPFRAMGGRPAPGRNLGGWYEYLPTYNWHTGDAGFAPGHCFGQWTSAIARMAVAQHSTDGLERAARLQELLGQSITPSFFDITRFPAYTLDKLHYGLLDAHTLLRSPEAFAVLDRVHRCALPSLPGAALDRGNRSNWRKDRDKSYGWDESYTLPENLYLLYAAGAGESYRQMARAYMLDSFFEPLARGDNVLGGLHGYSHVNALCSAMQAWFVDGSRMHLEAARNGYAMTEAQSYATGGWAPDELFSKPGSGKLLGSLTHSHNNFETPCGSFALLKLSRYLLQATRDAHYADVVERTLWNTMFGALPLQPDGRTFYYQDNNQSGTRIYSAHRWPCCAGTFTQVAADYGINSYLLEANDRPEVWLTQYLPSSLRWTVAGVDLTLTQHGDFPASEHVQLRLSTHRAVRCTLHLRIPAWCAAPRLTCNGQPLPLEPRLGFAPVDRLWRDGDRLDLHLPASLRLALLHQDDAVADVVHETPLAALCWGPWVLMPLAPDPAARQEDLLRAERIGSTEWMVRRPGTEDLFLRPFFAVGDGTYATYIRLS